MRLRSLFSLDASLTVEALQPLPPPDSGNCRRRRKVYRYDTSPGLMRSGGLPAAMRMAWLVLLRCWI